MKPVIVIIGRPNVGKSSLFNAIVGQKKAIVEDYPGVTRDRNYADFDYKGKSYTIIDTGGFFVHSEEPILKEIKKQVTLALEEADAVIALFDGKEGLNPLDKELVNFLRAYKKPVFYGINKIDHESHKDRIVDFYELGLTKVYSLSAEHKIGIDELIEDISKIIVSENIDEKKYSARIAILGKPNVGKSSLINAMLGYERAIVSDIPGTTRDAIDTEVTIGSKTYLFIDTAGIRRKSRISLKLEKFSVMEAIRALERVDIALLVVDAYEGVSEQEQKIAELIKERGKGSIIVLNKWDKIEKGQEVKEFFLEKVKKELPFIDYSPKIFISAKEGIGIENIFKKIEAVSKSLNTRISTGILNRIIAELQERNPLPVYKGKRLKIYYGTQQDVSPPLFILFANYPVAIPPSSIKYIEKRLREKYNFEGAPLKILVRKKR
ncbi:MAG: ribosome biogenesis GTPase Der [Proteobacteria bacterium]|nr:ribosome biogenesis GTPase Der [Pseudomonadota bacterium]